MQMLRFPKYQSRLSPIFELRDTSHDLECRNIVIIKTIERTSTERSMRWRGSSFPTEA